MNPSRMPLCSLIRKQRILVVFCDISGPWPSALTGDCRTQVQSLLPPCLCGRLFPIEKRGWPRLGERQGQLLSLGSCFGETFVPYHSAEVANIFPLYNVCVHNL